MSSIKVAVRMRPLNKREHMLCDGGNAVQFADDGCSVAVADPSSRKTWSHDFAFDFAFDSSTPGAPRFVSQADVFASLGQGLIESTFDGFNGTVFAYGQTGSGKTHTMMGVSDSHEERGLIPRLCDAIFTEAETRSAADPAVRFEIKCAYMEIYNEKVFDLLDLEGGRGRPLMVRESPTRGPFVAGLKEFDVGSFSEIRALMEQGSHLRHVACTAMNESSSRSHAVFDIFVKQITKVGAREIAKTARVNLVDLAGSERQSKTKASGEQLKEGAAINQSLSTLGLVISELVKAQAKKDQGKESKQHIPYRSSVLTWLLRESFGGNAKTVMIATISPATDNFEETLSTLRYADSAKQIKNVARINESAQDRVVRLLQEHIAELEEEVKSAKVGGGGSGVHAGGDDAADAACEDDEERAGQLRAEVRRREVQLQWRKCFIEATEHKLLQGRKKLLDITRPEAQEKVELQQAQAELAAALSLNELDHERIAELEVGADNLRDQLSAGEEYVECIKEQLAHSEAEHAREVAELEATLTALREQLCAGEEYVELLKAKLEHVEDEHAKEVVGLRAALVAARTERDSVSAALASNTAAKRRSHDGEDSGAEAGDTPDPDGPLATCESKASLKARLAKTEAERDSALQQLAKLNRQLADKDHTVHRVQTKAKRDLAVAQAKEKAMAKELLDKKLKAAERKAACVVM